MGKTIAHTRSMDTLDLIGFEDALADAAAVTMTAGVPPVPQMHLFFDAADVPSAYIGWVSVRPAATGDDAFAALVGLGDIAAALCASRLVFLWEDANLRSSLIGPSAGFRPALVVADVTFEGSCMRWREIDTGWTGIVPGPLPSPLELAARTWRMEQGAADIHDTLSRMARAGYGFRWADRQAAISA